MATIAQRVAAPRVAQSLSTTPVMPIFVEPCIIATEYSGKAKRIMKTSAATRLDIWISPWATSLTREYCNVNVEHDARNLSSYSISASALK